jgi:hypothetical protein
MRRREFGGFYTHTTRDTTAAAAIPPMPARCAHPVRTRRQAAAPGC